MANSILKPAHSEALSKFQSAGSIQITQLPTVSDEIMDWLASLKLMHQVPFPYLVPDERMLPPESIRFFYVDLNWLDALVDGAYSIGRYTSTDNANLLYNKAEGTAGTAVHQAANQAARNKRVSQFKASTSGDASTFEMVTGFLLRSEVVKAFKGIQVNAYAKSNYPTLPTWDGTSLPCLRLEQLSDEVLIGLFEGETYQLDIHEPSEGLHFGFDTETDNGLDQLSKNLRDMSNGSKLSSVSNAELAAAQVFRKDSTPAQGNRGGQVVNMYNLSALLFEKLTANKVGYTQPVASVLVNDTPPAVPVSGLPATGVNALTSSDFALQMVEGVGMVSFFNNPQP
ncbi:MAG TPA: hypothetical protein PKA00_06120 [Saprospiraceae bacterium]|nr:hypothetical protein [Saprospiraceae bacterium]HMQ82460.1 hypothetical protein [Saprospiraceae bacterium]